MSTFADFDAWPRPVVHLSANMSKHVSIRLIGRDANGSIISESEASDLRMMSTTLELQRRMESVEVMVKVSRGDAGENESGRAWCSDIEAYSDYDARCEITEGRRGIKMNSVISCHS